MPHAVTADAPNYQKQGRFGTGMMSSITKLEELHKLIGESLLDLDDDEEAI